MEYARDHENQLIERKTKILIGISFVAFIATLLQKAGYVTPGWVVFSGTNDDNVTFSVGIGFWYKRVCISDRCEISAPETPVIWSDDERQEFKNFKVIGTMAVVFSFFTPVIVVAYTRPVRLQNETTTIASLALLVCFIAGILALVTVGKIASNVHTAYYHWLQKENKDFRPGLLYSALLMGLGGTLNCLAFIGLCLQIIFLKRMGSGRFTRG